MPCVLFIMIKIFIKTPQYEYMMLKLQWKAYGLMKRITETRHAITFQSVKVANTRLINILRGPI